MRAVRLFVSLTFGREGSWAVRQSCVCSLICSHVCTIGTRTRYLEGYGAHRTCGGASAAQGGAGSMGTGAMLIPAGMFHPGGGRGGSGGGGSGRGLAGAASGGPRPFPPHRASPTIATGNAMRPPPSRQPQSGASARRVRSQGRMGRTSCSLLDMLPAKGR